MMLFLVGCLATEPKAPDESVQVVPESTGPEWYGDIEPFLVENCTSCHHDEGASPFSFEQLETVKPLAPVMLNSMRSGSMPPWLPDPDCISYKDERLVSEEEIERFAEWIEVGMPEGDRSLGESDVDTVQDIEATMSVSVPSGFIPEVQDGDQYRCFVLDMDFETETFVTQTQVKPGSSQVHHVLVYALDPVFQDDVLGADGADGRVGYSCFGAPFPTEGNVDYSQGFPTQIGAWVPGLQPTVFPDGVALRIKAGSTIVMQVHYSSLTGESTEDRTSYHLKTSEIVPEMIARTSPLAVLNLDIPAGESESRFSDRFTNYYDHPLDIQSVAAHMHLLGTKETAVIHRQDDSETCLMDIPEWDFGWQQSYYPSEQILLQPGESIEVTCTYDNSSENQPLVNGELMEPRAVEWGDGTLDEMCLLYSTFLVPYTELPPSDALACSGSEKCFEECNGGLECLMRCDQVEFGCLTCALNTFFGCGASQCAVAGLQAQGCLYECYSKSIIMGSPIGSCLEAECPAEYASLIDCANPVMLEECSNALVEGCGVPIDEFNFQSGE